MGPSLTPIGFCTRDSSSTWAPSICRVRSPIQRKWPLTSYGSWVRESIRVSACSYSRMSASWLEWNDTRCSCSDSAPMAFMKSSARSISAAIFSYCAPTGLVRTKSVFHACICRRSAYPPWRNARDRFSVAAEAWYIRTSRCGSCARLCGVKANPFTASPRYAGIVTSPRVSVWLERGLAYWPAIRPTLTTGTDAA